MRGKLFPSASQLLAAWKMIILPNIHIAALAFPPASDFDFSSQPLVCRYSGELFCRAELPSCKEFAAGLPSSKHRLGIGWFAVSHQQTEDSQT